MAQYFRLGFWLFWTIVQAKDVDKKKDATLTVLVRDRGGSEPMRGRERENEWEKAKRERERAYSRQGGRDVQTSEYS